jgi:WD40 repeat protein
VLVLLAWSVFSSRLLQAQQVEVFTQIGHTSSISAALFSRDGRFVFSASDDHSLKQWDIATGRELRTFVGAESGMTSLALSPDGRRLAGATRGNAVWVWDVASGRTLYSIAAHDGMGAQGAKVAFSPDGRYLLSGGESGGALKLWNAADGAFVRALDDDGFLFKSNVFFSPDGRAAFAVDGGAVKRWDLATGKQKTLYSLSEAELEKSLFLQTAALSPDGRLLAIGGLEKTLRIRDAKTGREVLKPVAHAAAVREIVFSPGGREVMTEDDDGLLRVFDVATGRERRHFVVAGRVLSISPDGRSFLASRDAAIQLWDVAAGRDVRSFVSHAKEVGTVAFSRSGHFILAGGNLGNYGRTGGNAVRLWDAATGRLTRTLLESGGTAAALSPDEREVVASPYVRDIYRDGRFVKKCIDGTDECVTDFRKPLGKLKRWNLEKLGSRGLVSAGAAVRAIATEKSTPLLSFSPSGAQLLSGVDYKSMELRDAKSGAEIRRFKLDGFVNTAVFSPDDRYILSGGKAEPLRLWSASTGDLVRTLATKDNVTAAAFSPDGRYVLTGSDPFWDKNVHNLKLRDVATGKQIRAISAHLVERRSATEKWTEAVRVTSIAFSQDGRWFLTGGADANMKLWEAATGREIRNFAGHSGYSVDSVGFSPDGKRAISSGDDGTIRIWDVQTGRELVQMVSDEGEWVAITPEGYFDASEKGAKWVNVRIGDEVFSIDNFFDTFYRPDIVRAKLEGKDISALAVADIRKIAALPPTARFTSPTNFSTFTTASITLSAEVSVRGGGVSELRLLHNGKVVSSEPTDGAKPGSMLKPQFRVTLVPGENAFRLVAFSAGSRVESNAAELVVSSGGAGAQARPRLFSLVVGINEYRNADYSLNYARSDASGFEQKLAGAGATLFSQEIRATLSDAEATQQNIYAALEKIQREARPEDVFVFYYAGHGTTRGGPDGLGDEFLLVPTDVTDVSDDALLKGKGIPAEKIQQYSRSIAAQKQLFILDACQSGAAAQMLAVQGTEEERAFNRLARNTGTFWLTSAGSEQFAMEFAELGHGVFTYALLEGLDGAADRGTPDQKISVRELREFLATRVPELSQRHKKGEPQIPNSYGYGQDFPIATISLPRSPQAGTR